MGFYDTWVARYTIGSQLQQCADIRIFFHPLRTVVQPLQTSTIDFPQHWQMASPAPCANKCYVTACPSLQDYRQSGFHCDLACGV